jgi:hypothetical protein
MVGRQDNQLYYNAWRMRGKDESKANIQEYFLVVAFSPPKEVGRVVETVVIFYLDMQVDVLCARKLSFIDSRYIVQCSVSPSL